MSNSTIRFPGIRPVFFLGASAGGVEAFQQLAKDLPEQFPSPVFFLLHRLIGWNTKKQQLPDLVRAKSRMRVVVPEEGEVVKSGTIYLARADMHLGIQDNQIRHSSKPDDGMWRPCIDVLFKQGAREYKERAVSILLTGLLDDGIEGLNETTAQGGVTIAQAPEDATAPSMPLNAVLKDHPNFVVSLEDLPKLMCELARYDYFGDQKDVTLHSAMNAALTRDKVKAG